MLGGMKFLKFILRLKLLPCCVLVDEVVDGNSERCLKWGEGGGVIKESQLKLLKRGVGKGRSCL